MITISLKPNSPLTINAYQAIGLSAVMGLALAALALYFCYLCLLAILLGLQLVVTTFNQLTAIISTTPVLHFLFVLGVLCLIVSLVKWMITQARHYVCLSVR